LDQPLVVDSHNGIAIAPSAVLFEQVVFITAPEPSPPLPFLRTHKIGCWSTLRQTFFSKSKHFPSYNLPDRCATLE
jgi:hypothetical protein